MKKSHKARKTEGSRHAGTLFIKNGRVVDPSTDRDQVADILVEDGKIVRISPEMKAADFGLRTADIIDASGKVVVPGLVDMHVHLREPGREDEETIETGSRAALKGGFTSVCCMANTDPPVDSRGLVRFVLEKAEEADLARVYPIGAVTKELKGEELAEIGDLVSGGCVAISDDGYPIRNGEIMRRGLEYTRMFGIPLISHSEDPDLSSEGQMNEGHVSALLGLKGVPRTAEETAVARDIALAEFTGGRLHIAHVSTKGSVKLIREAKDRGVEVTCECTPHHFSLTDEAVRTFDTNTKVNPPLRTEEDVDAIKAGLSDGTIDVIATDHAPHAFFEKEVEFAAAPFGMVGLETGLGLVITELVETGILSLPEAIAKLSANPARIVGLEGGSLKEGLSADILIIDPEREWTVNPREFASKSKNTPFGGWTLKGSVFATIVGGRVLYREGQFT